MDFRIVVRDKSCHKGSIVAAGAADATEGCSHNMCTVHVQEREREIEGYYLLILCLCVCHNIGGGREREGEGEGGSNVVQNH